MNVERAALTVLLLFVVAAPLTRHDRGPSVGPTDSLNVFTHHLDERIPSRMTTFGIPGVGIGLVRDGEVAWTEAYGWADPEERRTLTAGTPLMVHSISKSVTAWGVMALVERGAIGLDDPVLAHVDGWEFPMSRFAGDDVTVRMLLSHTAGLALGPVGVHYPPGAEVPPLRNVLSGDDARLVRAPGSGFEYSNAGYALLELLIEEVTGRSFAEYMGTEVLRPLGMSGSSFAWNAAWQPAVPFGHDLGGRSIAPYVYPVRASGGLFATVEDLTRFVAAGMTGPGMARGGGVLGPESLRTLYTPVSGRAGMYRLVSDGYGLGYFVETLPDGGATSGSAEGQTAVFHGGQGLGWMTHFHAIPGEGHGIVVLATSQRAWPFIALVVSDWARWNGFASVGMGRITRATTGLRILIGLLLVGAGWQAWRLVGGMRSGRLRFAPLARDRRGVRILAFGLAVGILGILRWSIRQEYLFVTSIFPALAPWLGWSALAVALALLATASTVIGRPPPAPGPTPEAA